MQDKVLSKVKDIVRKRLGNEEYELFLFWSRTTEDYKNNSDYDIWILKKDWKEVDFMTYLRIKWDIDEEIIFPVDFVDFARCDKKFLEIAIKRSKIIDNN